MNAFRYVVDLEITYLCAMSFYTDLDLHLQIVCFLRKERLCIDKCNCQKHNLLISKLTGNLSC